MCQIIFVKYSIFVMHFHRCFKEIHEEKNNRVQKKYSFAYDRITGLYKRISMKMNEISHNMFEQNCNNHVIKATWSASSEICRVQSGKQKNIFLGKSGKIYFAFPMDFDKFHSSLIEIFLSYRGNTIQRCFMSLFIAWF